jgi:hypothetical protein
VITPDGIQVCISPHGIMVIHSENLLGEVKHGDRLILRAGQGNDSNLISDSFVEQPGHRIASGRKVFIASKIHVRAVKLQSFVIQIYFRSFIIQESFMYHLREYDEKRKPPYRDTASIMPNFKAR